MQFEFQKFYYPNELSASIRLSLLCIVLSKRSVWIARINFYLGAFIFQVPPKMFKHFTFKAISRGNSHKFYRLSCSVSRDFVLVKPNFLFLIILTITWTVLQKRFQLTQVIFGFEGDGGHRYFFEELRANHTTRTSRFCTIYSHCITK